MLPTIVVVGRLINDVQLSFTTNQTAVVKFGVAASEKYKDKENTCFLDCVAFGKSAETINKFFVKGKPIEIVGKLKTESWSAQDGSKRSKVVCTIDKWAFVPQDKTEQQKQQKTQDTSDALY